MPGIPMEETCADRLIAWHEKKEGRALVGPPLTGRARMWIYLAARNAGAPKDWSRTCEGRCTPFLPPNPRYRWT